MKQPKVLILGDVMFDTYHIGTVERLSPEAPIPIVKVQQVFLNPGGAANVGANFAALGGNYFSVTGTMKGDPQEPDTFYPIVKHRLMVGDYQIARWDENDELEPIQLCQLAGLSEFDGIVVSDYSKGSIDRNVRDWLNRQPLPLFVDTKASPLFWHDRAWMFPNLKEYEVHKAAYNECSNVVLKHGADGLQWRRHGKVMLYLPGHKVPVRSVVGAGDTVIAAFAYSMLTQGDPKVALDFANRAAAVAVSKPHTSTVTQQEIENADFLGSVLVSTDKGPRGYERALV